MNRHGSVCPGTCTTERRPDRRLQMTFRAGTAVVALAMTMTGCAWMLPERERRRFDCHGLSVVVSTRQRVPQALGGEEYVFVLLSGRASPGTRSQVDNNGRWTDRLSASVAEDGSWVRLHVEDGRGPAAGRYRYAIVAFLEAATGAVVRTTITDSTDAERASGMFDSTGALPAAQVIREKQVTWRPCASPGA